MFARQELHDSLAELQERYDALKEQLDASRSEQVRLQCAPSDN